MGLDLARVEGHRPGRADREGRRRGRGEGRRRERRRGRGAREGARERSPSAKHAATGRGDVTHEELTRLQRTVARRMAESKATAPDFVMTLEVDMEEAVDLRGAAQGRRRRRARAVVQRLRDQGLRRSRCATSRAPTAPTATAQFELYSRVNVGVAVAGQDALVVPTVFDADQKSLGHDRRRVAQARRARARGQDHAAGALRRHVHGLQPRHVRHPPLRRGDQPAAGRRSSPSASSRRGRSSATASSSSRAVMELTLTCDHRILYGADAAEFLGRIREYLETPLRLVL